MYELPYYKERDEQVVRKFVDDHPFAYLTGCDAQGMPVATQVPVFLEEHDGHQVLRGHIMRNTPHHKAFEQNENVLVVFSGSHTYVSGTWYSNPHTPSTWNYMSVHVRGKIRFVDEAGLVDVVRKTALYFEGDNPESPTVYDNLPSELTQKLIKAIVGFEVQVSDMNHVFKLSQDRDHESYLNIIEKLENQDDAGRKIAEEMRKRTAQLFPDQHHG